MQTTAQESARLVDYAKAHLVVVDVSGVGPLIASGAMTINGRVGKIADPVSPGDVLAVSPESLLAVHALVPASRMLPIAFEDDAVIVVDKPAGIHVHPIGQFRDDTVLNALLSHAGARVDQPWAAWRPRPAHRLDRATSGLLLLAKHAAVHDALRLQFDSGKIRRRYRAVVTGHVVDDRGTIDAPLGRDPALPYRGAVVADGKRAVTHYRVVDRAEAQTTLELELETGRTHQIRAHLASIGHPIVGDTLYASGEKSAAAIELRAISLSFMHPYRHELVEVCVA